MPKFYMRGFSTAGGLWAYDREEDEIRRRNPENFAFKKGFYATRGPNGEVQDYAEIEKRLGVVEDQAAPIIKKLDVGGVLELRERYALAMFVALLKYRTTSFERQSSELNLALVDPKMAKEMLAPSVDGVKLLLKQIGYEDAELQEMAQKIYDHVHEHGVEYQPGPNVRLEQMLQGAHELGTQLVLGDLTVARAPEDCCFITADAPYAVVAQAEAQDPFTWEGPGIIPPGYEGWIPLSGRSLLIAGYEELNGRYIQLDESEVHVVNVMIAAQCEQFFVGGNEADLKRVAEKLPDKTYSGWMLPGKVDLSRHHT